MGGTGTWTMLSTCPELFAAAMPVAGNPSGCDAEKVAQTPLFTVMGTADAIMKIPTVEDFLSSMDAFSYRRAVPYVASHLGVSRYTVYKYLDEVNGKINKASAKDKED